MPDCIQGDPQSDHQLPSGERLRPLELGQHGAALAFMAGWHAGLYHRKTDTHGGNVK
jgi:hypothetical protein